MSEKNQGCCKQTTNNCVTQREHFNYLRNNSCGIWGAFSWGNNDAPLQDQRINLKDQYQSLQNPQQQYGYQQDNRKQQRNDQNKKGNRRVSFDDTNDPRNQQNMFKQNPAFASKGKNVVIQEQTKRPASAFQRKSRLDKDEQGQKLKNEQNMRKVQNYIEYIKPYTRGMSNTRFQDYFGKAAPECYGRANTNQPIGGIIYGNHLKTFNVNPHVYTNRPQYYQTHTTAINYGKRAKVCQDEKWKKLAKQLTKKLGLKEKNQTLIEGKEVVYVDVDDNNKYQVLKQNHEFQKANRQEIHDRELQYKKDKHQQYLDDINEYYAKKQQKIAENLSTRQTLNQSAVGSTLSPEQYEAKLNQQTIYRYHDKNGNVRLAADRHGMTCFVDMNFPENEAAYVQQLKNRMPIYPIRVEGQDLNLDAIRKQNCKKGHEQVYPSHYLLRNCEEPEVLKMLSNKAGVKLQGGKISNQGKISSGNTRKAGVNSPVGVNANKSFVSTNYSQNQQGQTSFNQGRGAQFQDQSKTRVAGAQGQRRDNDDNQRNWDVRGGRQGKYDQQLRANKSQILDRAWGNSQLAGQLACNMSQTCCVQEHLPHNEMNPQCYKSASGGVGRIPYAG